LTSLLPDWPRAFGGPAGSAILKANPEHFQVEERLGFEPDGEGEHVFLWVEKSGLNTEQVAGEIARFASLPRRQVSYAGLKDRQALTRQWFSVHLPGKGELPWGNCRGESFQVLRWARNRRKLKRGALTGNRFRLLIEEFSGEREQITAILEQLVDQGIPNYFGPQRFGHQGGNIEHAKSLLSGREKVRSRHLKGLYLSAARSLIFNQVLALRMEKANWNLPLPGDLLMFDGGGSFFRADVVDEELVSRAAALKIHPTGPLWGQGGDPASLKAGEIERRAAETWSDLARGLEATGMKAGRRPLRVRLMDPAWSWEGNDLQLGFLLPAGAYATTVIRELIQTEESCR